MVKLVEEKLTKEERLQQTFERETEVIKLLNDNDIWAESVSPYSYNSQNVNGNNLFYIVSVEIEGDWKHDHGDADTLVEQTFDDLVKVSETNVKGDGSDYYTSTHNYVFLYNYK